MKNDVIQGRQKEMVREKMYKEVQSYKQIGYTIRGCARELKLDRKTVKKYWSMQEDEYIRYLADSRERSKIMNPYYTEIASALEKYPNMTTAIIIDRLKENHAGFKPSDRSVRLYVTNIREELGIPREVKIRQYAEVSEQPPGHQAQVDMGQKMMSDPFGKKVKVYIFAMVMSFSRKKFVCFQEHPFNAMEFIEAHDLAFRYYGGRTEEIVYDQDRVMAVSENAGDLILTDAFENYRKYVGFSVFLCRGFDPESKGKIESVVKYVKNNFLSCRIYHGIGALNSEGLAWLDRTANAKIHDTTKMIPDRVFAEEIKHLTAVPELSKQPEPKTAAIRKTNVVHYRQNRYEVPKGSYVPGRQVLIEFDEPRQTVSFHDKQTGELLAVHPLSAGVGKLVRLPKNADRYRESAYEELKIKVLKDFEGIEGIEDFITHIIRLYPRYVRDQLRIMKDCADRYEKPELEKAMTYCIVRDLHSATDFRDTLEFFKTELPKSPTDVIQLPEKYLVHTTKIRSLEKYLSGGESN